MNLIEKKVWPVFKILLSAGTPIQRMLDRSGGDTHLFINDQAVNILKYKKSIAVIKLVERYKTYIDLGNLWADKGWKCFAHYYKPDNRNGYFPMVSAVTEGINHFNAALHNWEKGKLQKSMFYLGASAHIVQDICVPHHAMGIAFNGHSNFEQWSMENRYLFKAKKEEGHIYFDSFNNLIINNASCAQGYYHKVSTYNINNYMSAAKELLNLAQKSTACLFNLFLNSIKNKDTIS